MFMTQLDVVNSCLKTMGESKLNTLEDDHPYKDDALDLVDRVLRDVSSRSLWFNVIGSGGCRSDSFAVLPRSLQPGQLQLKPVTSRLRRRPCPSRR